MKFEYLSDEGITRIQPNIEDKCSLCDTFEDCPLIQALTINLVYPSAYKLQIKDCPMFNLTKIHEEG